MYVDQFKLTDRPFINGPDTGLFTPNDEFETAIDRIEQVLLARDSVAVITGGPGVGKTTMVAAAAHRVGEQALAAYVDMRLADPDLLFDMLVLSLGGESSNGDRAGSLHQLRQVIARHNEEQGRRITAVIDVSSLTIERAKRILQLAHMAGEPGCQLNILLLGPHALHKLLDTPGLIHLRQRVTFRHRVRPLSVAETESYIGAQLQAAGGQAEQLLAHGATIMVYRYVGGVPRLVNTMMDAVLSYAATRDADTVTPQMVAEVAHALGWRRLSGGKQAGSKSKQPKDARQTRAGATKDGNRRQEDPSPLEKSAARHCTTPPPEPETAESAPISDGTAMLMAAALDSTAASLEKADSSADLKLEEPSEHEKRRKHDSESTAMPEMSSDDTSATGMLRLEDLDARFAETVFGDETGMFKVDDDSEIKKAAG